MKNESMDIISTWFDGLNRGDKDRLTALFAPAPTIRNAANAPIEGPDAARRLLDEFFTRTVSRRFHLVEAAESGDSIFAAWTAQIVLRPGTTIAGKAVEKPVAVRFRGIDRLRLNAEGKIVELIIENETTSIPRAAMESSSADAYADIDYEQVIKIYFAAEEDGDTERALSLFHKDCVVINAAQGPLCGTDGARAYLESFNNRTSSRKFYINIIVVEDDVAFISFVADITFNTGASFGPIVARKPFDVKLPGIIMMMFEGRLIKQLWVCHETTTALRLAQETRQ